ncbi:hypothetical protein [Streptomyces nojiriensis]|uniref:Uncharacterized protein n=1 Tax=Streptomyces nojiriensis TaxID=66374 RepID=A0ABQ3SZ74_9ACTN|nr:hypothetical protein [Streptomyces nojiriensis]QTI46929.1 hypothetical protein JYK04_04770 [Streptomyces nojiriensis]GGS18642.1 hypothetical protein GCM10010205_55760 [Streptomyces nojiriensis]GHI73417.1 hypothetical protein Snoj_73350 [Streptomyces nojiriensis]
MLSTRMGKAVAIAVLGAAVLMAPATAQAATTEVPQGAAAPTTQADAQKTDMGWQ